MKIKARIVALFDANPYLCALFEQSNEEEHPNNSACSIAALLVWRIQQIAEKHRLRIQVRSGKNYFAKGQYNRAATLLNELIAILKGTDKAEESLYMLGMSYYNQKDYQTAAQTFIQYYNVYPRGTFTELARFHAGKALYLDTPEPRLDQSGTYSAIQQLQMFMEYFPQSSKKEEAQNMIFALQDKLVMKEYLSAKLYYNMGNYLGNNYQACVITAQNALKDYPYTNLREDLSILILRAKYELAVYSVEDKRAERYREAVDECYAFKMSSPKVSI